jgi:lipopolysaccharide/colanic/teichoic acid biosynthesis glycosyltransferase
MSTASFRSKELVLVELVGGARPNRLHIAERCAGVAALACCSPVIAAAALAVRALSGRSPFIAHKRVGLQGAEFWMLKLRTMWDDSEPRPGAPALIEYIEAPDVPLHKDRRDTRVTNRIAAMMRKFSIDELPQFLHVASGKMSFVGPRPITLAELETYYGAAGANVLRMRPGITGLWQVLGRNDIPFDEMVKLDYVYVTNWSLWWDMKILFQTVPVVLARRGAS